MFKFPCADLEQNVLSCHIRDLRHSATYTSSSVGTSFTSMISFFCLQPQAVDSLLRNSIGDFLQALHDPDLNVRRVALVAFNSAAHNKPALVRDLLDSVLPHLYNETKVRVSSHKSTRGFKISVVSLLILFYVMKLWNYILVDVNC